MQGADREREGGGGGTTVHPIPCNDSPQASTALHGHIQYMSFIRIRSDVAGVAAGVPQPSTELRPLPVQAMLSCDLLARADTTLPLELAGSL